MATKPKPQPKIAGESFTAFVTRLMVEGTTWQKLQQRVEAEAEKRGIKAWPLGRLKQHAAYRGRSARWTAELTEQGVRMNRVAAPTKAKPAAKAAAKPKAKTVQLTSRAKMGAARKTGKPTGKPVTKTTKNGRQIVQPVIVPADEAGPVVETEKAAA
jgi:hypothetical protein